MNSKPELYSGVIMRPGQSPAAAVGKPPHPGPAHEVRHENGLMIERNIRVPMRDGAGILVDIYRPDGIAGAKDLPVIIGWSPYGKHNQTNKLWPQADVNPDWISPYTAFEAPDPAWWCPHGYAILYPDPRGTWYSEGEMHHGGLLESQDCYDLIEWAGTRPWCNGKVGLAAPASGGDQSVGGVFRLVPGIRLSRRHTGDPFYSPRLRQPGLVDHPHRRYLREHAGASALR